MIGSPRVHHRVTDSTNERAKELALRGAPHGTLVTAEEQTAGRGRQGRQWVAPPGKALLMSVVLRHLGGAQAHLPLAAALATCEASELSVPHLQCSIKWPNDVWIDGRKLAGILVEGRPQEGWAVLGIGLNVATSADEFPDELRETATSLAAAAGDIQPPSVETVLSHLLVQLELRVDDNADSIIASWRETATSLAAAAGDTPPPSVETVLSHLLVQLELRVDDNADSIIASWRERDALSGQMVRWNGGEGTATGIDETGALIVETPSGRVTLDAGEVHLLR